MTNGTIEENKVIEEGSDWGNMETSKEEEEEEEEEEFTESDDDEDNVEEDDDDDVKEVNEGFTGVGLFSSIKETTLFQVTWPQQWGSAIKEDIHTLPRFCQASFAWEIALVMFK